MNGDGPAGIWSFWTGKAGWFTLLNDLAASSRAVVQPIDANGALAVTDLNRDGRPDIVVESGVMAGRAV